MVTEFLVNFRFRREFQSGVGRIGKRIFEKKEKRKRKKNGVVRERKQSVEKGKFVFRNVWINEQRF